MVVTVRLTNSCHHERLLLSHSGEFSIQIYAGEINLIHFQKMNYPNGEKKIPAHVNVSGWVVGLMEVGGCETLDYPQAEVERNYGISEGTGGDFFEWPSSLRRIFSRRSRR